MHIFVVFLEYHTCIIITRGLYIFYPIFHCSLDCRSVLLQTIFVLNKYFFQFLGLKCAVKSTSRSRVGSNGARTVSELIEQNQSIIRNVPSLA